MNRPLSLERMLFVPSRSRYSLEVERRGSVHAARAAFPSNQLWQRITESHEAQQENVRKLLAAFPQENVVDRSCIAEKLEHYDTFVFLGGDNHFTYCSHFIMDYLKTHQDAQKCVAGVMLDPAKSLGALLGHTVASFLDALPRMQQGEYTIKPWTTLRATVKTAQTVYHAHHAISAYFIGERSRLSMSRMLASIDGVPLTGEKSSGMLVALGAGTQPGSWYDNAHRFLYNQGDQCACDAREARILLTEGARCHYSLREGQVLRVESYNDGSGIVSADAHEDHAIAFPMGAVAEIAISSCALPVLYAR